MQIHENPENSDFNRKSLTSIPFGGPIGLDFCQPDPSLVATLSWQRAQRSAIGAVLAEGGACFVLQSMHGIVSMVA